MSVEIAESPKNGAQPMLASIWQVVHERGLKPGDQLPSIRELADRLEAKQTAVRDALLKAETMGLVKVLPRAGAFLQAYPTRPDITGWNGSLPRFSDANPTAGEHNLFHLLDARRLIEVELAGRAASERRLEDLLPVRRALEAMLHLPPTASRIDYVDQDIRFHVEIARLAGNDVLFAMQRTLMETLRSSLNEVPSDALRRASTDQSHIAIYEALVAGDAERARHEMRNHLSLAYDCMLRDLQAAPSLAANTPADA